MGGNSFIRGGGSPPRSRGAQRLSRAEEDLAGITPAFAGSTIAGYLPGDSDWDHPRVRGEHGAPVGPRPFGGDHPRVRGEHVIRPAPDLPEGGSPPRSRGARTGKSRAQAQARITPAFAGSTMRRR